MRIVATIITLICLAAFPALAATPGSAPRKDRSNLPITIKSNEMSADNKGKTAVFSGKVVAKQGDLTIYADKITINYGNEKGDVEKIEADGDVRIVHENRRGTASHAVYDSRQGRITLTGNPKVMQGADTITGKTIIYLIDEEKSVVTERVEVTIHPPPRKGNVGPR